MLSNTKGANIIVCSKSTSRKQRAMPYDNHHDCHGLLSLNNTVKPDKGPFAKYTAQSHTFSFFDTRYPYTNDLDKCVIHAVTNWSNHGFSVALLTLLFGLKLSQSVALSFLALHSPLIALCVIQRKLAVGCETEPHNCGCQERSTTVLQEPTPLVVAQFWNSQFVPYHERVFLLQKHQFFFFFCSYLRCATLWIWHECGWGSRWLKYGKNAVFFHLQRQD